MYWGSACLLETEDGRSLLGLLPVSPVGEGLSADGDVGVGEPEDGKSLLGLLPVPPVGVGAGFDRLNVLLLTGLLLSHSSLFWLGFPSVTFLFFSTQSEVRYAKVGQEPLSV